MLLAEIILWLRANARPWYKEARVIELLCKLRDGLETDDEERLLGKEVAHLPLSEVRQIHLFPKKERTRLLFRVLYSSLCRTGDALSFLKGDLFPGGILFFRGGKGDIDRYGLVDAGTEAALRLWLEGQPWHARAFELSHPALSKAFEAACQKLGLLEKYDELDLRLSPHGFRHNSSTHCFEREMAVATVQALLGHVDFENTDTYIHRSLPLCRERYLRSQPDGSRYPAAQPAPEWRAEDALELVIQFLLAQLPSTADLNTVIETLCAHRLESAEGDVLEFIAELRDEVGVDEVIRGDRLPLVFPRADIVALANAPDDPLDATLYTLLAATGMRPEEPFQLAFTDLDASELTIRVQNRQVIADPATFERLRLWQGDKDPATPIFPITLAEAERRLQRWARQAGMLERSEAMERTLTLRLFRHAFGSHRSEAGLDILTLKALLGHQYARTTAMYLRTAVGRHRAEYDRCHPLANGELALAPTPCGE